MPLHLYYVPKGLYTAQDKEEIAAAVTKVYSVLPDFYVVVLFITLDPEDYFVGAKKTNQFVRIVIQHIARQFSEYVSPVYCYLIRIANIQSFDHQ